MARLRGLKTGVCAAVKLTIYRQLQPSIFSLVVGNEK
jgi:hypothetical protein